jgi:hypothetical protein
VSDEVFEVFFADLNLKTQKRLLRFLKLKAPEDVNLNVFALAEIPMR